MVVVAAQVFLRAGTVVLAAVARQQRQVLAFLAKVMLAAQVTEQMARAVAVVLVALVAQGAPTPAVRAVQLQRTITLGPAFPIQVVAAAAATSLAVPEVRTRVTAAAVLQQVVMEQQIAAVVAVAVLVAAAVRLAAMADLAK